MTKRDEKILKHVGRYSLSIRPVIEALFFDGHSCDHVLNRLTAGPRPKLQTIRIGNTKLHYYALTVSEARRLCVPDHRARPRKGDALRTALQVLWFSCMSGKRRMRIERKQLSRLLGRGKGFGRPHVAELNADGEQGTIYRVYSPGPHAREDYLPKSLAEDYNQAIQHPKIADWIRDGSFGFAILVESADRQGRLSDLIQRLHLDGVEVLIEVVPGPMTLSEAVKALALAHEQKDLRNA